MFTDDSQLSNIEEKEVINMNNQNETYVCNANCPELDRDNSKHCTRIVTNEEDKFNMLNDECPCGNYTKWMLKETKHDYGNCLVGNFYDSKCTGQYSSWEIFKNTHLGFTSEGFDDTYHYVFRYDIHKQKDDKYYLELCMMLQRKGIYTHLHIYNINQTTLNTEVKEWLKNRYDYIKNLWNEVIE